MSTALFCERLLAVFTVSRRALNCNVASITKMHREVYARTYPTILVLPDGSSMRIRYNEPRRIIKLPLDLSTLSETERKIRIERRKPKSKVKIVDDLEDNYSSKKYLKYTIK